jgi:hypothetical protein
MHEAAPVLSSVDDPDSQAKHALSSVSFENVLTAHSSHSLRLAFAWYFPGTQGRQDACAGLSWWKPASQTWHLDVSLSSPARYWPLSQFWQSCPGTSLYLPAPHGVHLALPSESDDWPAKQSEQFHDSDVALTFPTSHLWHDFKLVSLPNSPGKHGKHEA